MNIVTSSSLEWILPTLAMLFSVRKHSHKSNINVYLILDINRQMLNDIQKLINDINFSGITFYIYSIDDIKDHLSKKYYNQITKKFPLISLGKFASFSFIPYIEKAFYFDNDLLIMNNRIDEFYDTDIQDKYAAVIEDYSAKFFGKKLLHDAKVSKYFNFGVALFNNKLMLKDGIIDIIKNDISNMPEIFNNYLLDQTYFNSIFKENVKFMDPVFNYQSTMIGYPEYDLIAKQYDYWSQLDLVNKAVIVHFVGGAKPWLDDFYTWQSYQVPFRLWQKVVYDNNFNEMMLSYPKIQTIKNYIEKIINE